MEELGIRNVIQLKVCELSVKEKIPPGISRGALMEFLLLHNHEAPGMALRYSYAVRVVKGDSSKT